MARRLTVLAVLLVSLAGTAAALNGIIQPGERLLSDGLCTMAFVFDGTGSRAGDVFVLTAAHCVSGVGQRVAAFGSPGGSFGTVVYRGVYDADAGGCGKPTSEDFALVQVDDAQEPLVVPWVKGHPGFPTGFTRPGETGFGDLVQFSGYGTGWTAHNATREQRVGALTFDDAEEWGALGAGTPGDSGGPLVHVETGKAIGIVNCVGVGLATNTGITVEHFLDRAASDGFALSLRTV